MRITLITPENRQLFHKQLEAIFKLRHEVFNEWLGWDLPHVNGQEFDKYDEWALHLSATDDAGTLLATWRLMPTTLPYLTAEAFPELLEKIGIISDPSVWDLSRFAVNRPALGANKALQERLLASMASAIYEFGLINGVAEYFSVQNSYITPLANRMLGDPVWQSDTIDTGATDATCYSYVPSMERLYSLRTQFRLSTPVLSQFQITEYS